MKTVLKCKSHDSLIIEQTFSTIQHFIPSCPCCRKSVTYRQYDELDSLSSLYGISRTTLYQIDTYITDEGRHYASLRNRIRLLGIAVKPSNGYTPLTILCNDCHSIYRFHRNEPTTSNIPPKYCIYCASLNIVISVDNDLDYLEVLANAYHTTPNLIKVLLDMFQHQGQYTHFKDFVSALRKQIADEVNA